MPHISNGQLQLSETERIYTFQVEVDPPLLRYNLHGLPDTILPPEPDEVSLLNAISQAVSDFYPEHTVSTSFYSTEKIVEVFKKHMFEGDFSRAMEELKHEQ